MPEAVLQQSPLADIAPAQSMVTLAGIEITERPFLGQYILRGRPDDDAFTEAVTESLGVELPVKANTIVDTDTLRGLWMSPDQWLLITDNDTGRTRVSELESKLDGVHAQLNDVSSGQTLITLKGGKALDVLAKGTTLDVHPRVFKPGQCAQTVFAKINVMLCPRQSSAQQLEYDLIVRRSFADFLVRWLTHACIEYEEQ